MGSAASITPKILAGPPCERCGGLTRIVGVAPHRRFKRRHVWTLECLNCGAPQSVEMPKPPHTH